MLIQRTTHEARTSAIIEPLWRGAGRVVEVTESIPRRRRRGDEHEMNQFTNTEKHPHNAEWEEHSKGDCLPYTNTLFTSRSSSSIRRMARETHLAFYSAQKDTVIITMHGIGRIRGSVHQGKVHWIWQINIFYQWWPHQFTAKELKYSTRSIYYICIHLVHSTGRNSFQLKLKN